MPQKDIDHKDQIKHNNRRNNIRESSNQRNSRNIGNKKSNTSGVKGVVWHKQRRKWGAVIKVNYKECSGGLYKIFDNAVCARLALEQSCNWSDCEPESPAFKYVQNLLRCNNV